MNPLHTAAKALRLAIFVLAGLWGQNLLAANVVQVGKCQGKNGQATTITAAVNLVSPGGLILVCPGEYPEQFTINTESRTPAGMNFFWPESTTAALKEPSIMWQREIKSSPRAVASSATAPSAFWLRAAALRPRPSRSVAIVGNSLRSFGTQGIAAVDFGLTVTISGNTISSAEVEVFNGIELLAATGSVLGNSISVGGNDFSNGILADASHAVVISGNTVSHAGTGIALTSDDEFNGDADDSKITLNNVFDSSGVIDLADFDEGAGILVCSNNNLVQGNRINGNTAAAVFVDTCFSETFGSTGNTIKNNDINEACAGVLLNTTGNVVHSNQFANTVQEQQNGGACPLTAALASAVRRGPSGNTRRRTPQ